MKEQEPKKVHLAKTHNLVKDCFLDSFGLLPVCGEKEATYLTDKLYNVTCRRCKELANMPKNRKAVLNEIGQKDFESRMAYYYEIVYYAWQPETCNRVLPKSYTPPPIKERRKKIK